MLRDLEDAWGWIKQLHAKVDRLYSGALLENSSITKGRMRFIGGLLLIDTGGTLQIIGTLDGEGNFRWVGPWEFDSPEGGRIAGDVDLAGDFGLTGKLTAQNVRIQDGKILVGEGSSEIVIDGATGTIKVNGSDPITLVTENGQAKIKVGDVGEIAGSDAGIQMMVAGDPNRRVIVTPTGIRLVGVPNAAASATPDFWLGIQLDGTLRRYSAGSGGPMGGDFDWPFDLAHVTSEFGMRVHPVTGVETMHNGIDFGVPAGANIPAASGGTVMSVGSDSGRGNYVVLSHPNNVETHYFHMITTPAVVEGQIVTKGTTLGQVGSTGLSTAPHLHFEVHINGAPVDPRTFASLQ